jgi:hypothetical protein
MNELGDLNSGMALLIARSPWWLWLLFGAGVAGACWAVVVPFRKDDDEDRTHDGRPGSLGG